MLSIGAIQTGDQLPELVIDITPGLIVAGAVASRDFQNVHHDKDAAQALGSPDIFMNILTTNGLVGRFLTDWSGPQACLKKLSIRLGMPNYPGDQMRLSGEVSSVDYDTGRCEVSLQGQNRIGYHVTGSAVLEFPKEAKRV